MVQSLAVETSTPQHTHDCAVCVNLGRFGNFDLYFCDEGNPVPTVLARFGNEGPDYYSGLPAAEAIPALAEARRRASEAGLL